MDIGFAGPKFTWERDREKLGRIEERLDCVLANDTWLEAWLAAALQS